MHPDLVHAYCALRQLSFGESLSVQEVSHLVGSGSGSPLVLEVGANSGQTTAEFIHHMPNARIICFEPDPRAIQKFKSHIRSPLVSLEEIAIGADNGTVMFHQSSGAEHIDPQGWDHSGSIRKPKSHLEVWPWVKFDRQIPVPMMRLDDWAAAKQIGTVDFIWADVQGAESDLLVGAQQVLSRTRFFYTEFSDDEWYEGQINFATLSARLPGFSLLHKFANDALFVSNNEIVHTIKSSLPTRSEAPMQAPSHFRYDMFSQGIFVDPMPPTSRLDALAQKLHPQQSPFPLVRMGSAADGGYLVPDDLQDIKACFSPGVDTFATFETDLLKRGIGSHLADYSVDIVPDGLQALSFIKKFVGGNTAGHHVALEDWIMQFEPNAKNDELILQMDVEGAEYETLLACPASVLAKFRIMVIEFHSVESWGHGDFLNIVEATFTKLLRSHFIVHSHPNNAMGLVDMNGFVAPRIFELTWLSRSRAAPGAIAATPHPLDFPNVSNMPPLDWGQCWVPRVRS